MQRPDFEIAMLELEAMTEDLDNSLGLATKVLDELYNLNKEGYTEFSHLPLMTEATIQCFLVTLERVKNGQPKRWFDDAEHVGE